MASKIQFETLLDAIRRTYDDEELVALQDKDFDACVIGIDEVDHRLIYSTQKVLAVIRKQLKVTKADCTEGETVDERRWSMAQEHFDFNFRGALVDKGPIYCDADFEQFPLKTKRKTKKR